MIYSVLVLFLICLLRIDNDKQHSCFYDYSTCWQKVKQEEKRFNGGILSPLAILFLIDSMY